MTALAATNEGEPARETKRDTTLNIRVSSTVVELIDRAASIAGKTRSAFVLESASQSAKDVLLDQTLFPLGEEQYDAFLNILDNPAQPTEALRRLMKEEAPWER